MVQGDISTIECDAAVHPTNGGFNTTGEVGKGLLCCYLSSTVFPPLSTALLQEQLLKFRFRYKCRTSKCGALENDWEVKKFKV